MPTSPSSEAMPKFITRTRLPTNFCIAFQTSTYQKRYRKKRLKKERQQDSQQNAHRAYEGARHPTTDRAQREAVLAPNWFQKSKKMGSPIGHRAWKAGIWHLVRIHYSLYLHNSLHYNLNSPPPRLRRDCVPKAMPSRYVTYTYFHTMCLLLYFFTHLS